MEVPDIRLPREQVYNLLTKLFGRIRCTAQQPIPSLLWCSATDQALRDALTRAPALEIPGFEVEEVQSSLESMINVIEIFLLRQPANTRGYTSTLMQCETWLAARGQRNKMEGIVNAYPNTEGLQGGTDNFLAISDFFSDCLSGARVLMQRMEEGCVWVAHYKNMLLLLSKINTLVPLVLLKQSPKAELVTKASELVACRNAFWDNFTRWSTLEVDTYFEPGVDGLRVIRCIFPDAIPNVDLTLADMVNIIENQRHQDILCRYNAGPETLNPERLEGLADHWKEINHILVEISRLKDPPADRHSVGVDILNQDVVNLLNEVTHNRTEFSVGKREVYISQIDQLLRRLDTIREAGVDVPITHRSDLIQAQSVLVEDKKLHESQVRLAEAEEKRRASEAANAAPKVSLIPLTGIDVWVPWLYQLIELTRDMKSEQSKCQIVFNSLRDQEDKRALEGVTSHAEQKKYLKSRYHKPEELAAAILQRGHNMPYPGSNIGTSKQNMITICTVLRDLKKMALESKLDGSYLKLIAKRVFTIQEYDLYLRAKDQEVEMRIERARLKDRMKKTIAKTSSRVGPPAGAPVEDCDDVWGEIDEAEDLRSLSDKDSDDEDAVSVFSIISMKKIHEDRNNIRDRRFFFRYIDKTLAHYRNKEAADYAASGKSQTGQKKGGNSQCSRTETAIEVKCQIEGCGKHHKAGRGKRAKATAALGYCPEFRSFDLEKMMNVLKKLRACHLCLTPGHNVASCPRGDAKCKNCTKKHHEIICTKKPNESDKSSAAAANSGAHKTATATVEPANDGVATTEMAPQSESHLQQTAWRQFQLTESEAFMLSRGERDFTHSCVGEIEMYSPEENSFIMTQGMFDPCSTDCWVTERFCQKHNLPRIADWNGILRTIDDNKQVKLPAVTVKLKNHVDKSIVKVEALVTKSIAYKPSIETNRFNRLCHAFKLQTHQVQRTGGECEFLLGLKAHTLQLNREAKFSSDIFPHVGIYSSPLLSKFIFVGVSDKCQAPTVSLSTSASFRTQTLDEKLHDWLKAEHQISLTDIVCESCSKAGTNCIGCKAANSDCSVRELKEDEHIGAALKLVDKPDVPGVQQFFIEYPSVEDFSHKYKESNSNERAARASSLSLRKKLEKSGKLEQFNSQVVDSIQRGHVKVMSDDIKQLYSKYPKSYVLINYVMKDTSQTTKLRVVSNSSVSRSGGSFNSNLMKGSPMLNSALEVVNGFCSNAFCLMTDLSQAYRSVVTGPITNSCRRFFWFSDVMDPSSITEMIICVMNFGDRPAGGILGQVLNRIASDSTVSTITSDMIRRHFYVDDGLYSASSKEAILKLIKELPEVFSRYSFGIKHLLTNFGSDGDHPEAEENFFGMVWSPSNDTLKPNLSVYVSKKVRGAHIDEPVSDKTIELCEPTRRIVLRVVGSIYCLTGRLLGPLQCSGRQVYAEACKASTGWDDIISDESCINHFKLLLRDIIETKNEFEPMPRAWVPAGYKLDALIQPADGSICGYGAAAYARCIAMSADSGEAGGIKPVIPNGPQYTTTVISSRSKVSSLDVGDNELLASLLSVRLGMSNFQSLIEKPEKLTTVLITDSQCTAWSHSVEKVHSERRRRNTAVRFHRSVRQLQNMTSGPVLLVWDKGKNNPADFVSKRHDKCSKILNSTEWRRGDDSYSSPSFFDNAIVYAAMIDQTFHWYGFPQSQQHFVSCQRCSTSLSEGSFGSSSAFSIRANHYKFPVQSCDKFLINIQELTRIFPTVQRLVGFMSLATAWLKKKPRCDIQIPLECWCKVITSSQSKFCLEKITQTLPCIYENFSLRFWITHNRLTPYGLANFHRLPINGLPIVSNRDTALVELLIRSAHIKPGNGLAGVFHFGAKMTLYRLKTGFFGVYIPDSIRLVRSFIENCVDCTRNRLQINKVEIGVKFPIRNGDIPGVMKCIAIDILGPYSYKVGPTTRARSPLKCWVLMSCCQITSGVSFYPMIDYSAKSLIRALHTHMAEYCVPASITCDAGSQLKRVAKLTRQSAREGGVDPSVNSDELGAVLEKAKMSLNNIQWHIAPASSQHVNGLVESNYKVAKSLLKSFLRLHEGQKKPIFKDFLEITDLFSMVKEQLNTRPILVNHEKGYYTSFKDLFSPVFIESEDCTRESTIHKIRESSEKIIEQFLQDFKQEIVSGKFTKFGSKAVRNKQRYIEGDFVAVLYPSQNVVKYGIVQNQVSPHKVNVRLCVREKNVSLLKSYKTQVEVMSTEQLTLLQRAESEK